MTHGSLSNNNNKTEGVGQINAAVPVLLKIKCDEVYNYKKRKRGGEKKKEAHFHVTEGVSLRALIRSLRGEKENDLCCLFPFKYGA